jgi:hydroxymethylpyrimidine pyrophosphatase-like HAD family hydrolase
VDCLYVDLDGTLLGRGGSLLRAGDGAFSPLGVRALEACFRADVEVVIYSGRRQESVFDAARLIGSSAYIFELGCGLVVDGELEWLTGGVEPSVEAGSIFDQIERSGASALLLDRYAGRLEYHTPWSVGREISHLFRGEIDLEEAHDELAAAGFDWLRLVDNGVISELTGRMPGVEVVHAYHLIPAAASKARAVARHIRARGYDPARCIAVGDSREDMDAAEVVGAFWLVANALERDRTLSTEIERLPHVRLASEGYGAGVYEAVITTLAEGRGYAARGGVVRRSRRGCRRSRDRGRCELSPPHVSEQVRGRGDGGWPLVARPSRPFRRGRRGRRARRARGGRGGRRVRARLHPRRPS